MEVFFEGIRGVKFLRDELGNNKFAGDSPLESCNFILFYSRVYDILVKHILIYNPLKLRLLSVSNSIINTREPRWEQVEFEFVGMAF